MSSLARFLYVLVPHAGRSLIHLHSVQHHEIIYVNYLFLVRTEFDVIIESFLHDGLLQ